MVGVEQQSQASNITIEQLMRNLSVRAHNEIKLLKVEEISIIKKATSEVCIFKNLLPFQEKACFEVQDFYQIFNLDLNRFTEMLPMIKEHLKSQCTNGSVRLLYCILKDRSTNMKALCNEMKEYKKQRDENSEDIQMKIRECNTFFHRLTSIFSDQPENEKFLPEK